ALIHVAELHGVADLDRATVRVLLADEHPEERRLPCPVRADDPDDAGPRQRERQILDQEPIAVALAEILDLDDRVAETRTGRDRDLELTGRVLRVVRLGEQALVRGQPGLALGLARLRPHPDPFELAGERALAGIGRLRLAGHALQLLL